MCAFRCTLLRCHQVTGRWAAAGVHVRFRLGGSCFPPLLFYKIYTHRPVADIGTFGPRNYACEALMSAAAVHNRCKGRAAPESSPQASPGPAARAISARSAQAPAATCGSKHSSAAFEADFALPEEFRRYVRPDGTVGTRSTMGWYQRRENNGWRPVNEIRMVDGEDCLDSSRCHQPVWHHNAALRRQERRRQRKRRRREWMVALYRCKPSMCTCRSQTLYAAS